MIRRSLSCAAVICLGATSPALAADLFEPSVLGAETYAESFSLSVDLGKGAYLQAQLAVSNLGPGDGQGACRFLIVTPNGKDHSAAEKFDRDKWSFAAPTLKVGPCQLRAEADAVVFEAPLEDGKVSARVHAKAQRISPPDAKVKVKDKFYETEIIVPWAKVSVELDVPGVKMKRVAGHGLLDHSRSTTLPGELASRWVRFRVLDPDQGRLFLVRYPPGGGSPRAWAWSAGADKPRPVGKVKVGKKDGKDGPMFRTLAMVGGKTWKMTSGKRIHRYAPVEKHGMLGKIVGSVVGNPITYTYVGNLEADGKRLTGIMEVTLLQ